MVALGIIWALVILAKLSGEDKPCALADWFQNRDPLLREAL